MKRILLVDDQAHVLRVIKLSLDRNGFEVDTALTGEIALQMLAENTYDIVITDLDMPGMTGKDLCQSIEQNFPVDPSLNFIIIDEPSAELSDWVLTLQKTELVEKPLSLRWLVARLNKHFGHFDQAANG